MMRYCANPERLMRGTDWPHPSIPAAAMPDDGHLLDLFYEWTPMDAHAGASCGHTGAVVRRLNASQDRREPGCHP
jgi:predicted TIM-barrel fold metal-dependent hydrolase